MGTTQIIAIVVFVVVMVAIVTEKIHRALAAVVGAMVLLVLHVVSFDAAMEHVDFNTLGVLLGMMLFVAVVKLSGLFEYLAIKCARLAKGNPWLVMVLFVCLTAVLSALLDNVTTVLLIGPMTVTVCRLLDLDPLPFFLAEIMASNIGGTATLIGDPPNIMIGSAAGLSFADFVMVDAPAAIICLIVMIGLFYLLFGRKFKVDEGHRRALMERDEREEIKNPTLLRQSVIIDHPRDGGLHAARLARHRVLRRCAYGRGHPHAHLGRAHRGGSRACGMDDARLLRGPVHRGRRLIRGWRHRHARTGAHRRHGRLDLYRHARVAHRLGHHLELPLQHPVRRHD